MLVTSAVSVMKFTIQTDVYRQSRCGLLTQTVRSHPTCVKVKVKVSLCVYEGTWAMDVQGGSNMTGTICV
jgi:hypothetical protein